MPNADGRREHPRRRNCGSPTSENSENANFGELRKAEVQTAENLKCGQYSQATGVYSATSRGRYPYSSPSKSVNRGVESSPW
jgi:hypothetical protein